MYYILVLIFEVDINITTTSLGESFKDWARLGFFGAFEGFKHVFDGLAVNEAPLYNREFFEFRDVEQEDYTWCRAIKPKATSEGKIKINLSFVIY